MDDSPTALEHALALNTQALHAAGSRLQRTELIRLSDGNDDYSDGDSTEDDSSESEPASAGAKPRASSRGLPVSGRRRALARRRCTRAAILGKLGRFRGAVRASTARAARRPAQRVRARQPHRRAPRARRRRRGDRGRVARLAVAARTAERAAAVAAPPPRPARPRRATRRAVRPRLAVDMLRCARGGAHARRGELAAALVDCEAARGHAPADRIRRDPRELRGSPSPPRAEPAAEPAARVRGRRRRPARGAELAFAAPAELAEPPLTAAGEAGCIALIEPVRAAAPRPVVAAGRLTEPSASRPRCDARQPPRAVPGARPPRPAAAPLPFAVSGRRRNSTGPEQPPSGRAFNTASRLARAPPRSRSRSPSARARAARAQ